MAVQDHIDKFGITGAIVSSLCCLGVPAVLSVVAALGLGFLVRDAILVPLLIASLLVVLWGLAMGWRRHRNPAALILGIAAALLLFVSAVPRQSTAVAGLAIVGLIGASVLNVILMKQGTIRPSNVSRP